MRPIMKYMLLVHHDERVLEDLGEAELQKLRGESVQLANTIDASGRYVDAAPLQRAATAACIRVRDGKRFFTDGPFAKTREQLGGYFLVTADTMEEAIELGAQIPGARIGTVEVRAVVDLPGLPRK